ncbi:hypothetical protein BIZ37_13020 [Photobacterium sp. BZF1]|uniref:Uncharacterized protein n=1 Tax=Photobacterium rosenbergii TaxID=294936 RepID=A0ABU3ZPE5_9GAMM|nr:MULTISPECIES: hypothetical protein [Photobacterium]MBC7003481.1 hypothetical protein [Photobacterium sp. BZF1]MBY5947223.1 hypothetical protein [Photobacterium rosenbergii]MDV5171995.1 hypothetical protein [Photobacterium rosenbergii]
MDIERFSPHSTHHLHRGVISPLPDTIEMTGFSDSRHYLEQHEKVKRHTPESHLGYPLDSLKH